MKPSTQLQYNVMILILQDYSIFLEMKCHLYENDTIIYVIRSR